MIFLKDYFYLKYTRTHRTTEKIFKKLKEQRIFALLILLDLDILQTRIKK